jgi:3-hydroxyacyl-CoA dehydrogenase
VAALHGTALGGGFELALACHARVIAPNGVVGLPEVKLGLIPGAGGTARVPHLAGPLVAIDLAATGRQVGAVEAKKLGLVDSIADDPRQEAIELARDLAAHGGWSKTTEKPIPSADRAALDAAVEQARRRARGAIAPVRAAEAVLHACDVSAADAIAEAQAVFQQLRQGSQSRALRHLFFAERAAARMPEGVSPRKLAQLGVVGGGTMGSGIAVALADAGFDVTLVEVSDQALAGAERRIRAVYERHVKSGRLSSDAYDARMARIRFALDVALLAKADLVIEAIIEDMGAKQSMFRRLSATARRDAVLASNTSYLDIDALAEVVDGPERVLGLHFFSPAHVMRLLEVVRGARTAPGVGHRNRSGEAVAQAAGGFRRVRRIHRQPHLRALAPAMRIRAGGWGTAAGGGRRDRGVRIPDGSIRRGRYGGAGHQLGQPQAQGGDPRCA